MSARPDTEPRPVALVTGAARRIGRSIALLFAARGHDVALHCHRSEAQAGAVADEIRAAGGTAAVFAADLTDADAVPALATGVVAEFGRVDVLVNNASRFEDFDLRGAAPSALAHAADADHALHVRAPLLLTLALRESLLSGGRGAVVNLGDAYLDRPGHVTYCASKAALAQLTRSLARALAPGIRVNMVSPGAVLPAGGDEVAFARLAAEIPLRRTGTPEEVAEAVYWLACEGDYVTGQNLAVDGGRY